MIVLVVAFAMYILSIPLLIIFGTGIFWTHTLDLYALFWTAVMMFVVAVEVCGMNDFMNYIAKFIKTHHLEEF
jgi:hypothetical protein